MISLSARAFGAVLGLACLVSLASCLSFDTVRCNVDNDCGYNGARCLDHVCVVDGDAGVQLDAGSDAGSGCATSADCTDMTKPICGAGMTCRACDITAATSGVGTVGDGECASKGGQVAPHCQATGPLVGQCTGCRLGMNDCAVDQPVCGMDNVCRGCTSHDECPQSLVCNDDGKCADKTTVAYVDKGCSSSAVHDGGKATPYCEIADALVAARPLIHVAGNALAYNSITLPTVGTTRLVASQTSPKAIISSGVMSNPVVNITLAGAGNPDITIDGFEITGTASMVNGISCLSATTNVKLTVKRSYIHDVSGVGVSTSKCDVTLDRNKVVHNGTGGITLDNGKFLITNNFFVANATGGPAVNLGTLTEAVPGHSFVHNTVADNARLGGGVPGGVVCPVGMAYTLVASLLTNNTNSNSVNCTVAASSFVSTNGSDVVYADPAPAPAYDYSLKTGNAANELCCVDKVAKVDSLAVDYFGAARPKGMSSDIGAHEAE